MLLTLLTIIVVTEQFLQLCHWQPSQSGTENYVIRVFCVFYFVLNSADSSAVLLGPFTKC